MFSGPNIDAVFGEVQRENGLVKVGGSSLQRPTAEFGADNNPRQQSFQTLLKNLTQTNVAARAFWATYTKLANGAYDIMQRFAERRIVEVDARRANDYDVANNHCFTFAMEVAAQAGLNRTHSGSPSQSYRPAAAVDLSKHDKSPGNRR